MPPLPFLHVRITRFILSALRAAAAYGALAVLVLWGLSRIASDRWLVSQYLFWIPTPLYLGLAGVLLAFAGLGRRAGRSRRRTAGRWRPVTALAAVGWAGALGYLVLVEFRMLNALGSPSPAGRGSAMRIMHWNVSGARDLEQVLAAIRAEDPHIAILADTYGPIRWRDCIDALEAESPRHTIWNGGILVISKFPLGGSHGVQWLGMSHLEPDAPPAPASLSKLVPGSAPNHADPGRAMFLTLDAAQGGLADPVTVWVVDLPSDWRQSRYKIVRHAAAAIWAWPNQAKQASGPGASGSAPPVGFPEPDLVVGDFNIPRGSASLGYLLPGMRHGFDQAGWGYAASFPAKWSLLHIDHVFTGPRLEVTRYTLKRPQGNAEAGPRHRYQVADVVWQVPPESATR